MQGGGEQRTEAKPLRVALCKSNFQGPISGADETLVTYATQLSRAGHDVTVVLLYPPSGKDPYASRLKEAGIRLRIIAEHAWLFSILQFARKLATHFLFVFVLLSRFPGHVRKIWQTILGMISGHYYHRCEAHFRQHRYDVLHIVTPDAGTGVMIRAAKAAELPVMYQELGTPYHMPGLEASYERLARVTPLCDQLSALSPRLARQWANKLPSDRPVRVLPLIIAEPGGRVIPRRQRPFDLVFGFAGRLETGKGPTVLVDAFAELLRSHDTALLRIAGNGPETYKVRARCRSLGIASSCDFVGNYRCPEGRDAYLQTLDVFVLPSFAEGTPNSLIEAMANGIPVVASGVGGIPDIVTADCGILVPPGEPVALAEAMLRLAQDLSLRRSMGQAARRRYEALFSPPAVLPALEDCYRSMMCRAGAEAADAVAFVRSAGHVWLKQPASMASSDEIEARAVRALSR